jgi:hypothetical protein
MNTGMLWFDNDPKTTLLAKIEKAVQYFNKKFGRVPEFCGVNPNDAMNANMDEVTKGCKLVVKRLRFVLPSHLWIGFEEEPGRP